LSDTRLLKKLKDGRRKKGISSVIGGVIMFGILFTVGFGYFLSVWQSNAYYQNQVLQRSQENLGVSAQAAGNSFQITVINYGIPANVTGYILNDNSTGTSNFYPVSKFLAQDQSVVLGGIPYISGHSYVIKVLTGRGNVFSTTYPQQAVSLAAQALSSGAIGDLYLAFQTYTWYNVTSGGTCPPTGSNVAGGKSSGYCLNSISGKPAFTIPSSVATSGYGIAFSVSVTDLNPDELNITLDQYSLIMQLSIHGSSGLVPIVWYVVSNSSQTILSSYNPIVLQYNKPTLLLFASSNPVGSGFGPKTACASPSSCVSPDFTAPVFLVSHGWKGIPTTQQANYGQNSPYVTTLYT
jgi:hypothetical protein